MPNANDSFVILVRVEEKQGNRSISDFDLQQLIKSALKVGGMKADVTVFRQTEQSVAPSTYQFPKEMSFEMLSTPIFELFEIWGRKFPERKVNINSLPRFRKLCQTLNIEYVGDLMRMKVEEIKEPKNFGKKSFECLVDVLSSINLTLGMHIPKELLDEYLTWRKDN